MAIVSFLLAAAVTWSPAEAQKLATIPSDLELEGKPASWITGYDVSNSGEDFALVVLDSEGMDAEGPPLDTGFATNPKTCILRGQEKLGANRSRAHGPRFLPESKHLAWRFCEGSKTGVAIDADKDARAVHDWILEVAWRPDGQELAYLACDGGEANPALADETAEPAIAGGKWFVVRRPLSGKESPDSRTWLEGMHLTWSSNGERLAFVAKDSAGRHVVCGTVLGPAHDEMGTLRFSADGKSIAYGARNGRELTWNVMSLE